VRAGPANVPCLLRLGGLTLSRDHRQHHQEGGDDMALHVGSRVADAEHNDERVARRNDVRKFAGRGVIHPQTSAT